MKYLSEPRRSDLFEIKPAPDGAGAYGRQGVLLLNLGTPDAPTPAAIRRYLAEFLSDTRVIELPGWLWKPVLYGAILTRRPSRLAPRYASIWMDGGSPLLVYTQRQAQAVQAGLAANGLDATVAVGMRYGQPSAQQALQSLKEAGCERILCVPLYPQYAASTTATAVDQVMRTAARMRDQPELSFIKRFHVDAGYIAAMASAINHRWKAEGEPDRLLLSFHGLPRACVEQGDPYYRDCMQTALALVARLGLSPERYAVTFQSRFGPAKWLEPDTEGTLKAWGRAGVGSVDVVCPGFTSDCLETLEEIAMEGRDAFLEAGGRQFRYIPVMNDAPAWLAALTDLIAQRLDAAPAGGVAG
ncbi:ferrochelatase [Kerstersia gyiorum]|uniref:Ferrochelatase n=1 Tax=Kerstersia gyiorum TaxID=206506 RepID=A0A4Q7MN55_9BURK|nr:ferrochelatase [Kerstersia gyiorum]KAB0544383.1 ferrochelatase [Kerstersia gyiorum]RZS69497.1 ferrochelatase [Kerstersia gyiorum]